MAKKIAIVTGASSGLGKEFLKALLPDSAGFDEIWIIARRLEKLTEAAAECGVSSGKVKPISMDLTEKTAYDELDNMLRDADVDVRVLINNAGCGVLGNVADMPVDGQIRMTDLNVRALTAVATIVVKYMHSGSYIINTCSIASFAPNPRMTVYSSTKAYVLSFSKGLHVELKPKGINVLAVCPSPMRTEFLDIAGISGGKSKAFETLPYCDPQMVAINAIKYAKKGKCVYTPRLFYKFYRILAKILPHNFIMKISKT